MDHRFACLTISILLFASVGWSMISEERCGYRDRLPAESQDWLINAWMADNLP